MHRSRAAVVVALVAALLSAACPSYTMLAETDRSAVERAHEGQLLYVKQSLYVGQFYDDVRYKLVHPRRFSELTYLQTVEGDAIPPPPAEGIIPAGTRVRVEKIEWPTGDVVFRRPLYTPRYTTWIYLRIARERGSDVTIERNEQHILLIPGGITDAELFNSWFTAALTPEDPNPWLLALPQAQQNGIVTKQAAVGMTYDALTAALGFPDSIARAPGEDGGPTREVAVYGAASVILAEGVVQSVRDPKGTVPASAPAAAAPPVPAPPAG